MKTVSKVLASFVTSGVFSGEGYVSLKEFKILKTEKGYSIWTKIKRTNKEEQIVTYPVARFEFLFKINIGDYFDFKTYKEMTESEIVITDIQQM